MQFLGFLPFSFSLGRFFVVAEDKKEEKAEYEDNSCL